MRRCLALAATAVLAGLPAVALTDEEVFRDFRFNRINPGARSLALGGAFVSLADDATAAQANPAGLGFLLKPEVFAELRAVDNAAQSSIARESLPAGIDTFVATGTDVDDTLSPSFLSAVVNYSGSRPWTLGISRQELLNIANRTVSSSRLTFAGSPGAFLTVGEGSIDVAVTNYNLSAGIRATDRLGFGATLTYSDLEVHSEVVNQVVDTDANVADEAILEPTLDLRTETSGSDDDVTYALGAIYKQEGKWHVGAVYRHGPRFSVTEEIATTGTDVFGVRDTLGTALDSDFSLPDSFAVGGAWLPLESQNLTLALDVERIEYSNLLEGHVPGVNVLTDFDAEFTIDDGTDYRVGAEYVLFDVARAIPSMALRGGVLSESESTIRAVSTGSQNFATEDVFAGPGRQLHGAIGLGINLERINIDLAADFAESDNEYVVSLIYRGK